ncbi:MAG: 6-phosphogluconolactonase, partial [Frankia sp.]
MGAPPEILVHRDATVLARTGAARLVVSLLDAQAARGSASLVLTGGGIGGATLRAVAESPAIDAVDWSRVDVWWGDERFIPRDDPDRNEGQARAALLDRVDVDESRVFPMGWLGGPDPTPEDAADRYAALLADRASPHAATPVPEFDVLLLGLGPDGHIASLFPGAPALEEKRPVVAVHNSPKPPPTRVSLTYPAIAPAREVWVIAAGEETADAVSRAL